MSLLISLLLVLVSAAPPAATSLVATDSLLNSRFATSLAPAWTTTSEDLVGWGKVEILKDGGVRLSKEMCGHRTLTQEVNLTTTDLVFSTRAKFDARTTDLRYRSTAAIVLTYLDSLGKPLGTTTIGHTAPATGWNNSSTAHYIRAAKPNTYADYSFNLSEELTTNLKGVNPAKVRRLRVQLIAHCSGTRAC